MHMNATKENNNANRNQPGAAPRSLSLWKQIESVKHHVFAEFQASLGANEHLLRLALMEADVLARQTGFPQLFFPALAAEKAANAARWQGRQQYLLRSHLPYALAA
jgi:hypothetical protein